MLYIITTEYKVFHSGMGASALSWLEYKQSKGNTDMESHELKVQGYKEALLAKCCWQ